MKQKILFFINGPVPTEADKSQASEIVGNVVFRNAKFAGSEPPEPCTGVAGCVPENYKSVPVVEVETGDDAEKEAKAAAKATAKAAKKAAKEADKSDENLPPQTPLIPAETGWKANS